MFVSSSFHWRGCFSFSFEGPGRGKEETERGELRSDGLDGAQRGTHSITGTHGSSGVHEPVLRILRELGCHRYTMGFGCFQPIPRAKPPTGWDG